jgi:hypothetical protein
MVALHFARHPLYFLLGHDQRERWTPPGFYRLNPVFYRLIEDFSVLDKSSMYGLPLCGCRDLAVGGQMTEKAIDLCLAHIFRMGLHTMESDRAENPVAESLFSEISVGTMMVSQYLQT